MTAAGDLTLRPRVTTTLLGACVEATLYDEELAYSDAGYLVGRKQVERKVIGKIVTVAIGDRGIFVQVEDDDGWVHTAACFRVLREAA